MSAMGDVLAVVALILGIGGTAWAMTVTMGLLFPEGVERSSEATQGAFVRGLLPLLGGLVGLLMLNAPFPLVKLLGWALLLAALGLGALGLAGLSRIAGRRLEAMAPGMGEYPAFLRGAGFLVAACMFPLLGWLLFAPVAFVVALGAGLSGMGLRRRAPLEA